jgi:hypothetical protein
MDSFIFLLQSILVLGASFMCVMGSIYAAEESTLRKKNMRAGTHDYYGNKLEK